MFGICATIFALFTAAFYLYFRWCFEYWKRKGVFTLPPSIPFGNATNKFLNKTFQGTEFQELYFTFKKKGLKYGGYYFATKPAFIPIDLDLIKDILTKSFQNFMDHPYFVDEEMDPLTGHLLFLKGEKWKKLRLKLSPSFTPIKIKMMFETLVNCTKGLTDILRETIEKKEIFNAKDVLDRFTTDIIGSCAFGLEINSLKDPNNEFRKQGDKIFDPNLKRELLLTLTTYLPKLMGYFKISLHSKEQQDFFLGTLKDTVEYRERNNYMRRDFLQLLMQLKNSGDGLTMNELASQLYVFFLAGYETAATTSTFLLYELANNPMVQENVRDEIRSVMETNNGNLTFEALGQMTYLDKCVQETLRKYPAVPILNRICTKPYRVPNSDLVIEKGMVTLIPLFGIQHDPDFYPNPEIFDPERFSEEIKANRNPFAWMPFGEGPRICIGLKFGLTQVKVAIISLLKDYKFKVNPKTINPFVFNKKGIILSVNGGVWLDVEKY